MTDTGSHAFLFNTLTPDSGEPAGHNILPFMKVKGIIKSCAAVVLILGAAMMVQSFSVAEPSSTEGGISPSRTFVRTNARCGRCGCSGYHGYKHLNGTFEGACSNSDGHGHTCRHSPEHHGLRSW